MSKRPCIANLDQAVEALYNLHVNVIGNGTGRHERPHKPCLLLAVLDLVDSGKAVPERIPWNQSLRDRFSAYFSIVGTLQDKCAPELPFRHLKSEGWWDPVQFTASGAKPLSWTPTVADALSGTVFASLSGGMERFFLTPADRMHLRQALVTRYFPHARHLLLALVAEGSGLHPLQEITGLIKEEPPPASPGRNAAFRRTILAIYDCQCAACGLRIRVPQTDDLTFVDAAHLIPFPSSFNDHPTNGIALCKNHHWAMDRFLIAPTPERSWIVSARLIEHRSDGEKSLIALKGKRVLPPSEPAFAPSRESLQWRVERLLA